MSAPRASLLICGTGNFAARIANDICATAGRPLSLHLAGRNVDRLSFLRLALQGRADIFGQDVEVSVHELDLAEGDRFGELLARLAPDVVVQAASAQAVSVLRDGSDGWSDLIQTGGYSLSLVFQAIFTMRVARAIQAGGSAARLVNCCYPDVVNELIAASGFDVTSGVGNISILAHILRGTLPRERRSGFRMLAHYRNLRDWRAAPGDRVGPPCRIWLDDREVGDVYQAFPIRLSAEPVPDVSGASAAPYLVALAGGSDWHGHLAGPLGLPGGYPVVLERGELRLDLPQGLTRDEAVGFNRQFEANDGAVVGPDGRVTYTGRVAEALARVSPEAAGGFHASELEDAYRMMTELRHRLKDDR